MSKAPELDDALQRVFKAPKLLRINGIGITLRGEFLDARVFSEVLRNRNFYGFVDSSYFRTHLSSFERGHRILQVLRGDTFEGFSGDLWLARLLKASLVCLGGLPGRIIDRSGMVRHRHDV